MKKFVLLLILFGCITPAFAQRVEILKNLKQELKEDTSKVVLCANISEIYGFLNEDSCLYYANKGLKLSQKIKYPEGQARMLYSLGIYYLNTGSLPEALKCFIQVHQIGTKSKDKTGIARGLFGSGLLYENIDPGTAIKDMLIAKRLIKSGDNGLIKLTDKIDINLGICYMALNQLDSAFIYLNDLYQRTSPEDFHYSPALLFFGTLQSEMGHTDEAINLLSKSVSVAKKDNDHFSAADAYYYLAQIYDKQNIRDSAIGFAQKSFESSKLVDRKNQMLLAANLLADLYEPVNMAESYRYLKIARDINNEIYGLKKTQSLQKLVLEEKENQLKAEQEQIEYKNRLRFYLVICGLIILVLIVFILYRNNLQRKKINTKLQSTLNHLKSTQSQLIQSEKMASLGELTAGIAHEIQNPLNFVNNFSEVSTELVDEMKDELEAGNWKLATELADDVKQNLEKINHHGKRADAIVKGMLQHSRTSSGVKEPTDINALADEYLRLAYHGLRAKDKSFNADFKTEFNESLPKINVIPQDIGRVLLNLINNAFYTVDKRAKEDNPLPPKGGVKNSQTEYLPTVAISTASSFRGFRGGDSCEGQWKWNPTKYRRQNLPTLLHHQTDWPGNRSGTKFELRYCKSAWRRDES